MAKNPSWAAGWGKYNPGTKKAPGWGVLKPGNSVNSNPFQRALGRTPARVAAPYNPGRVVAPYVPSSSSYSARNAPRASGGGGGGGGSVDPYAAERAAAKAAEAKAKKAGKDQTAKENKATQAILDALRGSLKGYESGKNTQLKNAALGLNTALGGILSGYQSAVDDYEKTGDRNEMDEASKSAANITNRARERTSLLEQAASQGAGETDQLRAQLQAFNNYDANQLEVTGSFYDTERQINSQITGAGSQAMTNRRNAWNANQEAVGSAWNEYWKNYSDTWSNIQRTGAQNTNINSDYSTEFKANYGGLDPVKEASKYAGKAYENQAQTDAWYRDFGPRAQRNTKLNSTNNAASATIKAPKAAEGSTLRGRW